MSHPILDLADDPCRSLLSFRRPRRRFDQRFAPALTLNKQQPGDAAQCQHQHLKGHLPDAADSSLAGLVKEAGGALSEWISMFKKNED